MDNFRPQTFDAYVGQEQMKEVLAVHIDGALDRFVPLEHVLLHGPPGCGKTTVASIIASELDMEFMSYVMPIKEQLLRRIVAGFDGVVLFDEIHRLSTKQQESLLPLIEDGYIQMDHGGIIEAGALTIIGATTELDKIIKPLYDRFQIKPAFDPYTDEEMGQIVQNMAVKIGVEFDFETAKVLGRATGGVPRNAKAIVNMARDLGTTDPGPILKMCRLTPDGLTENHVRYLEVLKDCGGTAGIEIIGAHIGLHKAVIIDLERLLVDRGMIEYSKQGRMLAPAGYKQTQRKAKQ
jgi:holliday junction DNA helicase RuvB